MQFVTLDGRLVQFQIKLMELLNSNILSANSVGQGSSTQLKQSVIVFQQERLVDKFCTKIKNKFCFQTSFTKFNNLKDLEI